MQTTRQNGCARFMRLKPVLQRKHWRATENSRHYVSEIAFTNFRLFLTSKVYFSINLRRGVTLLPMRLHREITCEESASVDKIVSNLDRFYV